jgi:hypothetical protein
MARWLMRGALALTDGAGSLASRCAFLAVRSFDIAKPSLSVVTPSSLFEQIADPSSGPIPDMDGGGSKDEHRTA